MIVALLQEKESNSDMSKILCVIDGMTDPYFRVNNYPNLSSMRLLRHVDTTQGQTPESLGCILRLLGTKRVPSHLRGYAEALGYGIPVNKNDLILRGSWFSLDEQGCCNVPTSAPESLPESEGHYYHLEQYKSLLVFPDMAGCIVDMVTYPPYACGGQTARTLCPKGCAVASRVFHAQLAKERCLILWGQSAPAKMVPFPQKAAVICGTPIVKGIAKLLNMTLISVSGATGDTDTNLQEKTKAAISAAQNYPFVLLHINGADEAAHRKKPNEKNDFLRKVDTIVVSSLLQSGHDIYVASDHGTDPVTGQHIGNRQPMFTNASTELIQRRSDKSQKYSHMTEPERKEWAIRQLQSKAKELGRLPCKADFDEIDRMRIKGALGPWPRAQEAAGLKERKPKQGGASK